MEGSCEVETDEIIHGDEGHTICDKHDGAHKREVNCAAQTLKSSENQIEKPENPENKQGCIIYCTIT